MKLLLGRKNNLTALPLMVSVMVSYELNVGKNQKSARVIAMIINWNNALINHQIIVMMNIINFIRLKNAKDLVNPV